MRGRSSARSYDLDVGLATGVDLSRWVLGHGSPDTVVSPRAARAGALLRDLHAPEELLVLVADEFDDLVVRRRSADSP